MPTLLLPGGHAGADATLAISRITPSSWQALALSPQGLALPLVKAWACSPDPVAARGHDSNPRHLE